MGSYWQFKIVVFTACLSSYMQNCLKVILISISVIICLSHEL